MATERVSCTPCARTQREMKAVRPPSPAHAPRADPLPHWSLPPPCSQPIHLAESEICRGAAQPRDLERSRAAPRDLGRSRAISEPHATPLPPPPHPTPPTAAPRYLGRSRSVARAAAHTLKKGRARMEPRGSDTCSLGAPPHPAPLLRRWRVVTFVCVFLAQLSFLSVCL